MRPEQAERLAELVEHAFELEGVERAAFLAQARGDDVELRAEVEALLGEQERAAKLMNAPAAEFGAKLLQQEEGFTELRAGEMLGDYRIVSLLGEGGMGEVYLADDTHFGRQVAIKLIKQGFGTKEFVRHFRQEERILAALNHPNIARLYGGAVTQKGLPYFVMEYVEGIPLETYAAQHSLNIRERLALFRKVCAAVSYAHQNLVIHRDLKPANIRVTAEGEPKLLDFGIARLLDPETAQTDNQTILTVRAMTPNYASPEQLRGERMTTASDVYSLGIVLYELLAGEKPNLRKNGQAEVKKLGGDLDNIIAKALRPEPERRYASVGQFSEDIRRYFDGLPIIARRDTVGYRASKFVRRNKAGVAAVVLVVLALLAGLFTTTWQARIARREEAKARHEKSKAEDVQHALVRMLNYSSSPGSSSSTGANKTVREILDEAATRLREGEFSDQPEIRVELEQIIAECYFGEGEYGLARKHTQDYLDLHRKLYGEDDAETLHASLDHASWLFGQGNLAESEKHYRQILPLIRSEKRKGNIKAELLANTLTLFGHLRRTQGDSREAQLLFRESLSLRPELAKESLYIIENTRSTLASTLADQGKFEEALQTAREAVNQYRKRGDTDSANFGFALTVLGGFLTERGDFVEADRNLSDAEAIFRKLPMSSSLWLGDCLRNQAISFYQQGRYDESLSKVTETLKIYLETFGPRYDNYPTALLVQGLSQVKTGHLKEGETILREAVKIRTESLPKDHYWVALANSALGECLTIQRRYDEAEPLLVGSYESLKNSQGTNNPRTGLALQRLVELYEKWQKPDLAARYRATP